MEGAWRKALPFSGTVPRGITLLPQDNISVQIIPYTFLASYVRPCAHY